MAKRTKEAKKVENRGATRKTPAPKDPIKLDTTAKTITTPIPSEWERVLGHSVRKDELAKGCEWYDDGGNEGLKQRPKQ